MKLKSIVVASTVCLLGLGTSAFAATGAMKSNDTARADMNQLQAQSNQIEAMLNGNEGSVLAQKPHLGSDWEKRITVSGQINVDGKWRSKHGPTNASVSVVPNIPPVSPVSVNNGGSLFQNGYYNDIYLNNSQLDFDATVNSWATAHISLTGQDSQLVNQRYRTDVSDQAPINLDEAYVTVGNLDKYSVYTTLGRQYVPFGVYDRHPIEPTLTQYLSQTQATAAKVGFALPMGVYGSAYTFRGQQNTVTTSRQNVNNVGGEVGIKNSQNMGNFPVNYQASVGYLNDIGDTDWIASTFGNVFGGDTGSRDVHAISVDGKVGSDTFAIRGNYVQSLNRFSTNTTTFIVNPSLEALNGARPWAFNFAGDYNFKVMDHGSTVSVSYQHADDVAALGLPQNRYGVSYTVDVLTDTSLTADIFQDHNSSEGVRLGNASAATQADLRLSVDF